MTTLGEMAEWFKAHAWKVCKGETLSWVRIPFSPPQIDCYKIIFKLKISECKLNLT